LKKTVLKSISKVKISKQKLANLAKNAKNVGVGFSKKSYVLKQITPIFGKRYWLKSTRYDKLRVHLRKYLQYYYPHKKRFSKLYNLRIKRSLLNKVRKKNKLRYWKRRIRFLYNKSLRRKIKLWIKRGKLRHKKRDIYRLWKSYWVARTSKRFLKRAKFKVYPKIHKPWRAGLLRLGWDHTYYQRFRMLRGRFRRARRYKFKRWARRLHWDIRGYKKKHLMKIKNPKHMGWYMRTFWKWRDTRFNAQYKTKFFAKKKKKKKKKIF